MERKNNTPEIETLINQVSVLAPPSEFVWDIQTAAKIWPELSQTRGFLEQIHDHQQNVAKINLVDDKLLKDNQLTDAIAEKIVSETEAIDFFDALSNIISDEDYSRLILYLPFEFIPDNQKKFSNQKLTSSINQFRDKYLQAWKKLLKVNDIRANFVDGNVVESRLRKNDPPRICKAIHLAPELIKKGLIKKEDLDEIYQEAEDETLKATIAQTIYFQKVPKNSTTPTETISDDRRLWLESENKNQKILAEAKDIKTKILNGDNFEEKDGEVVIEGIRTAIEEIFLTDKDKSIELFKSYRSDLSNYISNDQTKNRAIKAFNHFYRLGLIDDDGLNKLGIKITNLSGKFSENLSLVTPQIEKIKKIITEIKSDTELKDSILPVFLTGGSRTKGYGTFNSDTDIVIFAQKEPSDESKKKIFDLFSKYKIKDRPVFFHLNRNKDGFGLIDSENRIASCLNCFWVGNKKDITETLNALFPSFFNDSDLRKLYFENMERDLLQYRLMHRGYENHFPVFKNRFSNKSEIDGSSVFWDTGYRRLATRLFINNIFLPKI